VRNLSVVFAPTAVAFASLDVAHKSGFVKPS